MKRLIAIFSLYLIFSSFTFAQSIELKKLPKTVEEFLALRNSIATTPQGGAVMFVIALKIYADHPVTGERCLVIAADRSRLEEGSIYKGFQIRSNDIGRIKRQLTAQPYLSNAYFRTATPENGYKIESPYTFKFTANPHSGDITSGAFKAFIKSYGTSSPRPIKMQKNNRGYWKAKEWSSVITGVKPPVKRLDDEL